MRHKHIRSAVCAAAAACSLLLTAIPVPPVSAVDDADCIFRDSFESGDCGWEGRGGSTSVKTTADNPYDGSGALAVTGRSDTWHGPQKDISSVCTAGTSYSFSVCARFDSGSQSMTFLLSLAYKNSSGTTVYDHLAEAETMSGNYVQLANPDYTIPAGATDTVLYVETKSGSTAFTIDEAICAKSGTAIDGPKPVKFTLGDVNTDGTINAADLTLAKRYMGKDFPNKTMQRAADVDQSGTVDTDDINWIFRFIMAEESAYPTPVKPPQPAFDYDPALQYHPFPNEYLNQSSHPGKVVKESYNGPQGQNSLYVYLPPDYDANQKYNIFYLLHGGSENENTLFHQNDTMMQNIFDHMIENGDMQPMIVVTPTWNQSGAEGFWSEFRDRVVPFVEGKYPTYAESTDLAGLQASRFHRAYGGFSMGGVSTWAVIAHCLDIVAYFMPLSGDHWGGTNTGYDKAKAIADAVDKSGLKTNEYFIFCATGSNDIAYGNMNPQIDEMKKMSQFVYTSDLSQGNFYYMVANGKDHCWANVRHYVYDILPYFFHEGQ